MGRLIASLMIVLTLIGTAAAQDRPEAVLRAAQTGDAEAQLEMGTLYEFGFRMTKNRIPALAWYMLAAAQGNQKAIKRRDLLMRRMSQPDIERARQMSAELTRGQPSSVAKAGGGVSSRMTSDTLSRLLGKFVAGYQAGDLNQFMSLFAENAQTDERFNRGEILKEYEDFFQTTDLRRMKLADIKWQPGNGVAQVWGRFNIEVRNKSVGKVKNYAGRITLHIEQQGPRVLITRLYHSQTEV